VKTRRSLFRRYFSSLAQDAGCDDAIIGHVGRFGQYRLSFHPGTAASHGGDAEDVLRTDVRSDLCTETLHVRCQCPDLAPNVRAGKRHLAMSTRSPHRQWQATVAKIEALAS
jgi:hypothetical protein